MSDIKKSTCEVAIAGGGPVGLLCALLLADNGARPIILRKKSPPQLGRTVALMQGSLEILREAGISSRIAPAAAPLRAIRLIDDTGALFRAPAVTFEADELELEAFGLNVPNDVLQTALEQAAAEKNIEIIEGGIESAAWQDDKVRLAGTNFCCEARVVVAADGRHSKLRSLLDIKMKVRSLPQQAVTAVLTHSEKHAGISTEFHTRYGPFTLVPLPENNSSLVAVTNPEDAAYLMKLDDETFAREIERRSQFLLGKMQLAGPRGSWPLQAAVPQTFASRRVLLAGEAAHVLPPIGAQGLNLGIRDAKTAAEVISRAFAHSDDPGSADVINAYNKSRAADIRARSFAVDLINRSLLSPFLPAHMLRGFGLMLASFKTPFRKVLIKAGLGTDQNAVKRVESA